MQYWRPYCLLLGSVCKTVDVFFQFVNYPKPWIQVSYKHPKFHYCKSELGRSSDQKFYKRDATLVWQPPPPPPPHSPPPPSPPHLRGIFSFHSLVVAFNLDRPLDFPPDGCWHDERASYEFAWVFPPCFPSCLISHVNWNSHTQLLSFSKC